MTLAQLQTALQALGYGTDSATVQAELLNAAYRRIAAMRPWWWLRKSAHASLTTGSPYLTAGTLGTTFQQIETVNLMEFYGTALQDPLELTWLSPQQMELRRGHTDMVVFTGQARATPEYWTFSEQRYIFDPIPDKAYEVLVAGIEPVATLAGATEPKMPAIYQDAIVWDAIYLMAVRQRDMQLASLANNERGELLRQMAQADNLQQNQTGQTVEQTYDWNQHARRY